MPLANRIELNLTQTLEFQTDSLSSFERVLDTVVRILFEETPSQYSRLFISQRDYNFDSGRRWIGSKETKITDPQAFTKPRYSHVLTVGNSTLDLSSEYETFDNYTRLVQRTMEHLRNFDISRFYGECGPGFNDFFMPSDGSIVEGFRLSGRPREGGCRLLDVSLCHIYYGK